MFRNPRENLTRISGPPLLPSTGRPPSPSPPAPSVSLPRQAAQRSLASSMPAASRPARPSRSDSAKTAAKTTNGRGTPARKSGGLGAAGLGGGGAKGKGGRADGSILSFFKREEQGLFVGEAGDGLVGGGHGGGDEEDLYVDSAAGPWSGGGLRLRFQEDGGAVKRRKLEGGGDGLVADGRRGDSVALSLEISRDGEKGEVVGAETVGDASTPKPRRRPTGPFVDHSDSDDDEASPSVAMRRPPVNGSAVTLPITNQEQKIVSQQQEHGLNGSTGKGHDNDMNGVDEDDAVSPKREETNMDGFEDFEGVADFDDDVSEGEEFQERRYMAAQRRIELSEAGFEGDLDAFDDFPDEELLALAEEEETVNSKLLQERAATCAICSSSLAGITDHEATVHVNNCLDGNPSPLPNSKAAEPEAAEPEREIKLATTVRPRFQRPAKPGQENPIRLEAVTAGSGSAFSKLMSNHAEDDAWATAAAAENASRGKPAFQRTCPFYKIMPGMYICVDAFRYGGVKDCRAYFLSHFHSDHYIGLTSSWSHGPIYASKVTVNLMRQQLRVDAKYLVALEFEKKTEVPGTQGVFVTMISANHCPGSSLFLFEKVIGQGKTPKVQRILHCGDFRACRAHVEHPLLKPEVLDSITGKTAQQKIDVCYLDTTYLNPKYAFPSQEEVIKACSDMCVSLNKARADEKDGWEQMKSERAGAGMAKFVQKEAPVKEEAIEEEIEPETKPNATAFDVMSIPRGPRKPRGRLLVVVGTYSIGKERICLGIARALESKIYAPAAKLRICACLEDEELSARLTKDPREAQVHMTPLFEIRADTLEEYLDDYRDVFSRAVGFRPTGWNYRPPNSRFVESPAVRTVLRSSNWRSSYSIKDLVPQRGSTSKAASFGVPYSEHSSFRELTMFCCALRIDKVVPTVNVGSAKSREMMRSWVERWQMEKKKNGLFRVGEEGSEW